MAKWSDCLSGHCYEFQREREGPGRIGRLLPRNFALSRLRRGADVYTPLSSDAKALAKDVQKGKAEWEGAHQPGYYPHYHPADDHGMHIFYGEPGYRLQENRRERG